jgi:hypothetical protein
MLCEKSSSWYVNSKQFNLIFQKQLSGHENIVNVLGEKVVGREGKREVFILMELADDSLISAIQRKAENNSQFKEEQMYAHFYS